jgi:nicotinamidase-related amidase
VELLRKENTGLIIVDVQKNLMAVMGQKERVTDNLIKLLQLSKIFNLPVVITEQYPKWLGTTLPDIIENSPDYDPIEKLHFDCCEVDAFNESLKGKDLKRIIVTGVETHICVFQTCVSLLEKGYHIQVPQDAVTSRTEENWRVGLGLIQAAGATITSTESIIYQVLKKAGTKEFKQMLKFVK